MLRKRNSIEIGREIKRLRKKQRLTQEQFSEKLGVDPTLISKIETGKKSNLTNDLLIDIAEICQVTLNDLCYEREEKTGNWDEEDHTLKSDIQEVAEIMKGLSVEERAFLMKMIRGVA